MLALQVILLVLPLLVLSTVGFLSLRQDRAYAEHEAITSAQDIAEDLLASFRSVLSPADGQSTTWFSSFALNKSGALLSPPPIEPPNEPVLDTSNLNEQQLSLWREAQHDDISANWTNAIETWKRFIAASPSKEFAAIGHYSLAVAYERSAQSASAVALFKSIPEKFPDALGESGTPLGPLARFKSIDWKNEKPGTESSSEVEGFCSFVVTHPSFLTGTLLTEAIRKISNPQLLKQTQSWLQRWERDQLCRTVAQSAIATRKVSSPGWFWAVTDEHGPIAQPGSLMLTNVTPGDFNWLIVRQTADTNFTLPDTSSAAPLESASPDFKTKGSVGPHWFFCQTQSQIEKRLYDIVQNSRRIPNYRGVSVSIAGQRLNGPHPGLLMWHNVGYFGRRGGGVKREYLAETAKKVLANTTDLDQGAELLGVSIWLTSPETLYRNQRARTFWFAALIGIASLGATIGLIVVWRGFSRQVQLNEMKSNFVSSVSHELRAPIASVRLMAESLESGKLTEPQKKQEYYKFIGQECRRLSALIENVLDFARIEQGRKQYEMEPTDVSALMRQTVALMEPYGAERQISLKLEMNEPPLNFPVMDGRAMQQALVNLIDNAIKHSATGSQVSVGLDHISSKAQNGEADDAAPAQWLQIWVEDKGPGIPQDQHEKIFERFYRLGSELRRETPGVGIGLSIVKHIVDAHGGKIVVRSSPGAGSRFTIQLPLSSETSQRA